MTLASCCYGDSSVCPKMRDSLVIEFLFDEPIGFCEKGHQKMAEFLCGLGDALQLKTERLPEIHESLKYGLSGWLPLAPHSAIHAYVWDVDRSPAFMSIDISMLDSWNLEAILNYIRASFRIHQLVHKSMRTPQAESWRDLAPDVLRQRLFIGSSRYLPKHANQIGDFLPILCEKLEMVLLTTYVHDQVAWMHWETSGCIIEWSYGTFSMDIYTCKAFDERKAIQFTQEYLGLTKLHALPF